jgi:carbon-monoxide dehydrogenase medium subunit
MKPPRFEYFAPESLDEALELLADGERETKVLAGGQSLVPMLNFRLVAPDALVDIGRVAELRYVRRAESGAVEIGAGATQAELLALGAPLLSEGLRHIGHPQIRSRGTVCGSLVHNDPTAELPALAVALDATLTVAGPSGRRQIAADDFFVFYYQTALEPGELLVEVTFPPALPGTGWCFREIARRRGDFALVGAIAVGELLVLFGVGERPLKLRFEPEDDVARLVRDVVDPVDDVHASAEYRREAAADLAAAVMREARERCASG